MTDEYLGLRDAAVGRRSLGQHGAAEHRDQVCAGVQCSEPYVQRVRYTDSHQIHTRSAVFRACFAMFRACFADVSQDVSHVSRVFREVSRLFRTVAHRPSTRKVYVLHRGSSYSHIFVLEIKCDVFN